MTSRLRRLADSSVPGSIADRFRQRRFAALRALIDDLPVPVRILDIGGTQTFWERLGYAGNPRFEILLANRFDQELPYGNMSAVVADAADLSAFADAAFDVVISNSVLEHLSTSRQQQAMADGARRVGRCLYLQTPSRYFPLEPHFLFPFFALL